ncbi:MAG: ATP cone domain-containing protein [Candidatus Uhrbacteria bacterium]
MPKSHSVTIVKASGEHVSFNEKKLAWSIERAGASKKLSRAAAAFIATRVRDGMTTREIARLSRSFLASQRERGVAMRYSLKDAMRKLGPEGYHFERYIAAVLRVHGYEATLPDLIPGMHVRHEVDVVARRDGQCFEIECKYRNAPGLTVNLKDVMASWARYDDLRAAHKAGKHPYAFDGAWVICNTRITTDGIAFGEGQGMRLIGWRYPASGGLEQLIEGQRLYPITIIPSVTTEIRDAFARVDFILCRDFVDRDAIAIARRSGISVERITRLQREAAMALQS